ncbi:MAG: hypothetical protein HY909_04055 [Deltaproteobacteria bacterium]|nr:hypothetical protein [Deltaproteobacteria bacterium]
MSSINRYLGVRADAQTLELDYLLDLAELPAWSEIERLDTDHDGAVTPAERERYLQGVLPRVEASLELRIDGEAVTPREVFHGLEAPAGQNGMSTLRVAVEFRAPLPAGRDRVTVTVTDRLYSDRSGWRELSFEPSPHGALVSSDLPPGTARAGAALAYPEEALRSPPRIDRATFVIQRTPGGAGAARRPPPATGEGGDPEARRLASLVHGDARSWRFLLFALAVAFGLGAGHALSPGHGKALVAAWLVGSRGRPRHALALGLTVTVTHTASVFLLGMAALFIERSLGSDRWLRALELASGVLVATLAASQLPGRVRRLRERLGAPSLVLRRAPPRGRLAPLRALPVPYGSTTHDHGDGVPHDHGPPPDTEVRWRSLVALGVSGGLVPCPGALVVLLTAISVHRVGLGLALLVAFSAGLASVLSGLGLLFVLARGALDRLPTDGRLARALPVLSSTLVFALGASIAWKALAH